MTAAAGSRGSGWANQGLSLVGALARRWLAIVLTVVLLAVVALLVSKAEAAKYRSTARVFLNSGSSTLGADTSSVDPAAIVRTQAQLAGSNEAVNSIAAALKVSHKYVTDRLTVTPSDSGYYFVIAATDGSKAQAERMVRAAEDAYTKLVATSGSGSDATLRKLEQLRTQTQTQLNTLRTRQADEDDPTVAGQITRLNQLLNTITQRENDTRLAGATAAPPVQHAEAPEPAEKVAPKPLRNALVAGLAGLFLAAAAVWALYLRRPTVQGGKAAADLLGVPLLAQIPGGRRAGGVPTDDLVASMGSVLAPAVKVVALTPGSPLDLSPDVVAGLAASWSDEQGVVLILDAAHRTGVRGALERLPRGSSADLPRWASEPTCLARASGRGRGHVLYSRVAPTRAARPGGLAPILADRAPVVDLVLLLTPSFAELPVTAASAMQADVVMALTSADTPAPVLSEVVSEWPGLAERVVGLVHDGRSSYRRSARRSTALVGSHGPVLEGPEPGGDGREKAGAAGPGSPVEEARGGSSPAAADDDNVTERLPVAKTGAQAAPPKLSKE